MPLGDRVRGMKKSAGKTGTPAAAALLAELRKDFLDEADPDPEKAEVARDLVIEEPTIVYLLTKLVDENEKLTIEQRGVIAGFGVDVLVNHTDDKQLFDAGLGLAVDLLLRVSANPKLIEPDSMLHRHVADALAAIKGDLDAADDYHASMKKTLKALRDFQAQAEKS